MRQKLDAGGIPSVYFGLRSGLQVFGNKEKA